MNRYNMYPDPMTSLSGDLHAGSSHQWSQDVCNGTEMQWQQPYEFDSQDNYNMRPQTSYGLHQPMLPQLPPVPRYPPMYNTTFNQGYAEERMGPTSYPRIAPDHMGSRPISSRPMGPQSMGRQPMNPQSLGPRPMGHLTYPRDGYPFGQPQVLRQLHPSNEQLRSAPEMHRGMHQDVGHVGARQQFTVPAAPSVLHDIRGSPANTTRPSSMGELPKSTMFEMTVTKSPVKRPLKGGSSSPSASPKKKIVARNVSPSKAKTDIRAVKEETPDSPNKESKLKPKSRVGNMRFISASIIDVLRWRRQNHFSDAERANLAIEIVGTVFDISGTDPVNISIQSQDTLKGIFWETDLRLDRNVILPGCLVRVVLRIPKPGYDFHFLRVSPLVGPSGNEGALRRISYVTTTALENTLRKT